MRLLLALVFALLAGPVLAQAALPLHPTGRAVVTGAIEKAIRPGFEAYAASTAALASTIETQCGQSDAGLAAMRAAFGKAVTDWSGVELYQIGPLTKDNRTERTLFWPDRKGIALKQVQAILAGPDWDAFDAEGLRGKSVAVQGLGALEYVLFGTGSEQLATIESDFRCNYGLAIATLLKETAGQLAAEWDDPSGIADRLIHPAAADAEVRNDDEVKSALVGLLAHGVEAVRDQRILPFLGREGEVPKPRSALFWRSGLTLPSILAEFAGLRALYEKSEIGAYAPTENFEMAAVTKAFDEIDAAAVRVTLPLDEALADPAQRQALADIVMLSQQLGQLFGEQLPAALGLSVGFSSLDGD